MSQDAYTRAGVSQSGADAAVAALVAELGRIDTGKPSRVVPLPGHYASVLRLDERTGIAFGTDGVGTKMVVAEQLGRLETIGIDCVAMNVNDLVCVGAEPIALVDFILCPTADPDLCGAIGVGLRRGAELAGIEIPGGEIAQVGDVVNGLELAGSAIGLVALDAIVTGARIAPGDAVIGLPSSGLHSNGYTLARAALAGIGLDDERLGRPLGEILLEPTEIYVRAALDLLASAVEVRGLAHITGDGLNNLLRLGDGVGYAIDDPLPVPPVFELIASAGGIDEEEMHEVFNMGCGFCVTVSEQDVDQTLEVLRSHYPAARRIGAVTDRAGAIERG
ncbi:MAG TPA: phosphoribosylformylglycinamidine cyclo-ligase [Solirubrobacterales bacterium]|nr:phosphoribosylformylglycinamidine cyclo-ligase [Solirubrobacterales bacterium]